MIEVTAFGLRDPQRTDEFVALDARYQQDFAYQQPGLLRRTVGRSEGGRWIVISLWASAADADRAAAAAASAPLAAEYVAFVDAATVATSRFDELPG